MGWNGTKLGLFERCFMLCHVNFFVNLKLSESWHDMSSGFDRGCSCSWGTCEERARHSETEKLWRLEVSWCFMMVSCFNKWNESYKSCKSYKSYSLLQVLAVSICFSSSTLGLQGHGDWMGECLGSAENMKGTDWWAWAIVSQNDLIKMWYGIYY